MPPRPWTAITRLAPATPPHRNVEAFSDPVDRQLIWRIIQLHADVPDAGRSLFHGPLRHRNRLWRQFQGYVRQASDYESAAQGMSGTSAALLHYYCALNLAKAELLITHPAAIDGRTIHHGLSFNPSTARSMSSDHLRVVDGVFPLLYHKRTGCALKSGTTIPVKRLLRNISELAWEATVTGLASPTTAHVLHVVATDDAHAWSLMAVGPGNVVTDGSSTSKLFLRHYEEVLPSGREPWELFGVSQRWIRIHSFQFFEAKAKIPIQTLATFPEGFVTEDVPRVCELASSQLAGILEEPLEQPDDALITASLYRSRLFAMPSALARYALMFYVSSLVRYRPDQVDPRAHPPDAWMLSAFTDQAARPLLHAAASGILDKWHTFGARQSFRL